MKKRGITLIEIMVVIMIIIILVSILLPAAMGAKSRAKEVVCVSNMRQIYLAMKLYEDANGEYPPNSTVWPAFKAYYPVPLRCPASLDQDGEYSYIMFGRPGPGSSTAVTNAFQACVEARSGDYPLVRDKNHLIHENAYLPGSRVFLLRENGQFSSVPYVNIRTRTGPCDPKLVTAESNL